MRRFIGLLVAAGLVAGAASTATAGKGRTLKFKAGRSIIAPSTMTVATTSGCAICWVPDYAERSLTPYTIIDAAVVSRAYKVPR